MLTYRALTHISLGLSDGRTLNISGGQVLPPSWAAKNESTVLNLISSDALVPTASATAEELALAERAAEPREVTSALAHNVRDAAATS